MGSNCFSTKKTPSSCTPSGSQNIRTLSAFVADFRNHCAAGEFEEIKFFQDQPSFDLAINCAALAINADGKRYSHQCLIRRTAIPQALDTLRQNKNLLASSSSFDELHSILHSVLHQIYGVGELYIYDTALRLGAFLELFPEKIYLHAGTRVGAFALGLNVSAGVLEISDFPEPIRSLQPHEIESFLCVYKDDIKKLMANKTA